LHIHFSAVLAAFAPCLSGSLPGRKLLKELTVTQCIELFLKSFTPNGLTLLNERRSSDAILTSQPAALSAFA
jgi:hypothetical protein